MNRFLIEDTKEFWDGFKITDTQSNEVVDIHYAWLGDDIDHASTPDFAPLFEMSEIEGNGYNDFRLKLHKDQKYAEQQFIINRRHEIWSKKVEGKGKTECGLHCVGAWCKDVDGKDFYLTSDITMPRDYVPSKLISKLYLLLPYQKIQQFHYRVYKLNKKFIRLNLSSEEIQFIKASKKSENLLKEWLSEDEYRWLKYEGSLKIVHSQETYIIKKEPHSMVKVKNVNNKTSYYCMIPKDSSTPSGDELLSKILMIKTNPKKFKEIAIQTR